MKTRPILFINMLLVSMTICTVVSGQWKINLQSTGVLIPKNADSIPAIHVTGTNWTASPYVSGAGTWANPYLIHNLAINGTNAVNCIEIDNSNQYFQIVNCTLVNATQNGILLSNASNGYLTAINATGNTKDGLDLVNSDNNTIVGNYALRNTGCGLYMSSSNNNSITGNDFSWNYLIAGNDGMDVDHSSNNIISGNNCTGDGLYLNYANDNVVNGNHVVKDDLSDGSAGLELDFSVNNTVIGNNCSENGGGDQYGGLFLYSSTGNIIISNICNHNDWNGLALYDNSNNNTVSDNNCSLNILSGLVLDTSNNNVLSGNNCTGNYIDGISLQTSTTVRFNLLQQNLCAQNNQNGIELNSANNNTVIENNCSGNGFDGVYIDSGTGNGLQENNCSQNIGDGIDIDTNADNSTIWGNTCYKNHDTGALIVSEYNQFFQNFLVKNFIAEINDIGSNNTIFNNVIINFLAGGIGVNSTTIQVNQITMFSENFTGGLPLVNYQWNFGDGTLNSTTSVIAHQFNLPGNLMVVLTVTESDGQISVFRLNMTILPSSLLAPELTSITPSTSTTGVINLNWGASVGAVTYLIYRSNTTIQQINGLTFIANITTLTWQDTVPNGTYYYAIVAENGMSNSSLSNCESIKVAIPLTVSNSTTTSGSSTSSLNNLLNINGVTTIITVMAIAAAVVLLGFPLVRAYVKLKKGRSN